MNRLFTVNILTSSFHSHLSRTKNGVTWISKGCSIIMTILIRNYDHFTFIIFIQIYYNVSLTKVIRLKQFIILFKMQIYIKWSPYHAPMFHPSDISAVNQWGYSSWIRRMVITLWCCFLIRMVVVDSLINIPLVMYSCYICKVDKVTKW